MFLPAQVCADVVWRQLHRLAHAAPQPADGAGPRSLWLLQLWTRRGRLCGPAALARASGDDDDMLTPTGYPGLTLICYSYRCYRYNDDDILTPTEYPPPQHSARPTAHTAHSQHCRHTALPPG